MTPQNVLIEFVRDRKKVPFGVLAAVKRENGDIHINYSMCNTKKDKFDRELGKQMAIGRAMRNDDEGQLLPRSLFRCHDKFKQRVARYYKVSCDEIFSW